MNPPNIIRNFSIIAHIDHGKTTLTDRFLELTKTVEHRLMHERFLDSHPISQERGVTIKLAPVRMSYILNTHPYILNLIDTPGHIDFSYEVSRSLMCCEGVILLVDATQGIQAQTLTNFNLAKKLNLKIIPVINKIDLENAASAQVSQDLINNLNFSKEEIIFISAKTGENVPQILQAVVERIPPPQDKLKTALRALIFDSFYHPHKGVVAYIRVFDGELSLEKLRFLATDYSFLPQELGYLTPQMTKCNKILNGEIGYLATGLKDINFCQVGDTITSSKLKNQNSKLSETIQPLPGYQSPKPVVFFDFYPTDNDDFPILDEALNQLKLNDVSLSFVSTGSPALGKGFRVGFLGVFHALITQEKLERDYNLDLVLTSPSVEYEVVLKNNLVKTIQKASDLPQISQIKEIREPWLTLTVFVPQKFLGPVFKLFQEYRGKFINQEYFGALVNLTYELPLIELISGFYDRLKSLSSGFASLDYQLIGFRPFNAQKLEVIIQHQKVEALTMIVDGEKGEFLSRSLAKKLKATLKKQMFEVPIQVSLNGRVVARETLKAFRKDVTAKLYGGDQTRKDKLLKKQKKGKKRMKQIGQVTIPQEAFMSVLKIND